MLIEVKPPKPDSKDSLKTERWVPMTLREHPKVSPITNVVTVDGIDYYGHRR
jgi:hypothetical protein